MKKQTQLAIQEPEIEAGLLTLVKEAKIELTKAEAHATAFNPFLRQLSEYSRPLADLDKENPTSQHALIARENRLKIVKVRTGAEDIKDERKALLLLEGNFIQANFNFVKSACELTESQYLEIEKHQEKLEKEAQEKIKSVRWELLAPYETDVEYLPLDVMTEDQFQKLLSKEKESFEAVTANRAKVEADRIEAERLAEVARIEAEKAEAERIRLQAIENERLKKEAEVKDIRTKELMPLLIMIRDFEGMVNMPEKEYQKELAEIKIGYQQHIEYQYEQKKKEEERLNAENKAREKEMVRLENEAKKAKEEQAKLAAELREKQEQEEREKQQAIAEQNERDAQAKAALLAPDKDKVKAFYNQFIALQFPELESEEGKAMSVRVNEALAIVKQVIIQDSKTLL